ncbi:hypothetical protein L6R52_23695 [Myxococcota bacterium]|nr:hypothetical protein [Myxococcota bacterium]
MGTSTRKKVTPAVDDATLDDAITGLVERFPDGIELSKVRAALPPMYRVAKPRLDARITALATAGRVHRWGKAGLGPTDVGPRAIAAIHGALAEGPVTAKQLEAALPPVLKKEKALVKRVLEEELRGGRIFEHPAARARAGVRFARVPADASNYLAPIEKVLATVAKKLTRAGVDRAALIRALAAGLPEPARADAPPPSSPAAPDNRRSDAASERRAFFDAVSSVRPDARLHVLVSIAQVRARLAWSKEPFDRLVLTLAREGRITLHEHDHPSGLAPEERATLVADDAGRHYIGLVLEESA